MAPRRAAVAAGEVAQHPVGATRLIRRLLRSSRNRPERRDTKLKLESGNGLLVGGVTLPLPLAELGLIDEYEFLVQPAPAGHGPRLFEGLSKRVGLTLVSWLELGSGVVAMRYEPTA